MLLSLTLPGEAVYKASPKAVVTPNKINDDSLVLLYPQSLLDCPWLSRQPLKALACFTVGRLIGRGLWKGRFWLGLRGTGPHELLFGLFQEQMWYLGLAV